jgi:hypothetical protein
MLSLSAAQRLRPGRRMHFAVLIVLGLTALLLWPRGVHGTRHAAPEPQSPPAEQAPLWIDLNIQPGLIEWFDAVARPGDMAHVDQLHQIALLNEVAVEPKVVVFKSAALAEQLLPRIADKVQVLGYNLEHGPLNPLDEQADPVGSIQRMRALADRYGMQLALGSDHDFALSHGVALAPYVDIFIMQVQRVQDRPEMVHEFVVPMAEQVREANPAIATSIQIRTEGDVDALVDLVTSLRSSIDGVSILTSPQTTDFARALVAALRPDAPQAAHAARAPTAAAPAGLWMGLAIGLVLGVAVASIGWQAWARSRS